MREGGKKGRRSCGGLVFCVRFGLVGGGGVFVYLVSCLVV